MSPDNCAVFSHTRLSIIDLSPAASQPMRGSGNSLLAFNGEVYNFRDLRKRLVGGAGKFVSESDSEVVLSAIDTWGDSAYAEFDGMFAIAHYDPSGQVLTLARDPIGQKPLYYMALPRGGLAFASELTTLLTLADEPRLSLRSFGEYLRYGYTLSSKSLVQGIERVEPGTFVRWRKGDLTKARYWWIPEGNTRPDPSEKLLMEELECQLSDAVTSTLVSDVPVALLLSGGLDSSVIAALAARHKSDIDAFSVTFPGHSVDEGDAAEAFAHRLGVNHTRIEAPRVSPQTLLATLQSQDEPIADPSVIPTWLLFNILGESYRVTLGGDGGDELFGGYEHYRHLLRGQHPCWRLSSRARSHLLTPVLEVLPKGARGRFYLQAAARPSSLIRPPLNRLFQEREIEKLVADSLDLQWHNPSCEELIGGADYLNALMRADLLAYLPNDILQKVDRYSMQHSVEARSPFLEKRVINFSISSIPTSLKIGPTGSKVLLRRLLSDLTGDELPQGRKQGFTPPLHDIFQEPTIQGLIVDVLRSAPPHTWNINELEKWIKALRSGRRVSWQVFALTALISWQLQWGVIGPQN